MSLKTLMRWWQEHKLPILKCERVGHCYRQQIRTVLTFPSLRQRSYTVAIQNLQSRSVCWHCKNVREDWHTVRSSTLTSLTLPTAKWDEYELQGFYILVPERWFDYEMEEDHVNIQSP